MTRYSFFVAAISTLFVAGSSNAATTRPTTVPAEEVDEAFFAPVVKALGAGKFKAEVFTIVKPRNDLDVGHIDLGEVPVAAGLESVFYFYKCPCGKMNGVGQLCVADYEINSVIDELRKADIQIVSIAPMFLGERPRILAIRFQARGNAEAVAGGIKNALQWMQPPTE